MNEIILLQQINQPTENRPANLYVFCIAGTHFDIKEC